MTKKITHITKLVNDLLPVLTTLDGFVSFNLYPTNGTVNVQMHEEEFTAMFLDYSFRDRECDQYPTELYKVVDGVTFFALSKIAVPFGEAM